MEFYFPTETGEQLAFSGAAAAALLGLFIMFAPGLTLRFFRLAASDGRPEGLAALRFFGAAFLGLGLSALLLAQPMVYLAVAATFGLGLFGVILSILQDHGAGWRNGLLFILVLLLAGLPLIYVTGLL